MKYRQERSDREYWTLDDGDGIFVYDGTMPLLSTHEEEIPPEDDDTWNCELCGTRFKPNVPFHYIDDMISCDRCRKEVEPDGKDDQPAGPRVTNDVRHQPHYEGTEIQPIDYMRAIMPRPQFEGYLRGNVIKYISRYDKKNGTEDLKKAEVYLGWLIDHMSARD